MKHAIKLSRSLKALHEARFLLTLHCYLWKYEAIIAHFLLLHNFCRIGFFQFTLKKSEKRKRLTLYENIHISWEPLKRSWQATKGLFSIEVMHAPDGLFSTKIVCNCSNFVSDCFVSFSLYRPARFTSMILTGVM